MLVIKSHNISKTHVLNFVCVCVGMHMGGGEVSGVSVHGYLHLYTIQFQFYLFTFSLMTLPISQTILHQILGWSSELLNGNGVEGDSNALIWGTFQSFHWMDRGKPKNNVTNVSVPAQTRGGLEQYSATWCHAFSEYKKTVMWQSVVKWGNNFEYGTSASPGDQEWIQRWPYERRFLFPRIQKSKRLIIYSTGFHTQTVKSETGCMGMIPTGFQYQDDFCFTPGSWHWVL
jgi:hypothetical protein